MIHFRFIVPRKKEKKIYILESNFRKFYAFIGMDVFFSFDVAFLVSRKKKKKEKNTKK